MAGFRRPKYLACFYCGRRTSTRHEEHIRRFECPNCEATNWLDENGEITDPPATTTRAEAIPPQYAVSRTTSPKSDTSSRAIFCSTCLKNQHLFTASLAQYLPEDPSHPDYAELEKNYYTFRRRLEQRYPQICADCEPKVLDRIRQAKYTAQTDHLRRMIDNSRTDRSATHSSPLDAVAAMGKYTWLASLVFEVLSHVSSICDLILAGATTESEMQWGTHMLRLLGASLSLLPRGTLANWSLWATVLSVWWNPRFAQTMRGFTRHIIGLPEWYMYQFILLILKGVVLKVSTVSTRNAGFEVQIAAHGFVTAFMAIIYVAAQRSVRTDTTPLFKSAEKATPQLPRAAETKAVQNGAAMSMSDLLDEISQETKSTYQTVPGLSTSIYSAGHREAAPPTNPRASYNPVTRAISGNPFAAAAAQSGSTSSELQLGSLNISDNQNREVQGRAQYEEEMDWSPTLSRHRAFNSYGSSQRQGQGFGDAPVKAKAGQFWYKVPPAPTNPAQRVFNPPNAPHIRTGPAVKDSFSFQGAKGKHAPEQNQDGRAGSQDAVDFAEASFFPPTEKSDPRNSLSDLFGQSFSLSPSQDEAVKSIGPTKPSAQARDESAQQMRVRLVETAVLGVCLATWFHADNNAHVYRMELMLGVMFVWTVIACRINMASVRGILAGGEVSWAAAIGMIFGIIEAFVLCVFAIHAWRNDFDRLGSHAQGGWLIGTTIAHELWYAFI